MKLDQIFLMFIKERYISGAKTWKIKHKDQRHRHIDQLTINNSYEDAATKSYKTQ